MTTQSALEKWGLNPNEIKVYTALIEIGTASVQELARKTGVERTNTYSVLEGLIAKGLAREEGRKNKKIFSAEPPEKLLLSLKDKEQALSEVLPELKSIFNLAPRKPKVLFFEGKEGLKTLSNRSLEKAKDAILFASATEYFHEVTTEEYEDTYYIPERVKRNQKIRMLTTRNEWAIKKKQTDEKELRETRFFQEGLALKASTFIYGNEVSFITSDKELMGVVIESQEIAQMMKMFFEIAWQNAEK